MWIWITLAAFMASFLSAWLTRRAMKTDQKEHMIGDLFVDPEEPEDRGGVYVAFDKPPKDFGDGQIVSLTVKLVRK